MKNFITNSGTKNLKRRLAELINKSEELKFLVGFFYFSGIKELYEEIKKNNNVLIKVLVGLNVDKINYQLIEYANPEHQSGNQSNKDIGYSFFDSIRKSINSEEFDNLEFYKQVRFFVELIRENRLTIRKTIRPNHAKLYIFKLEKEQVGRQHLFITGSSNLTKTGLTIQDEFNVEISDYGFEDAENYFDYLWENESIKITEDDVCKKRLLEIIEKETLIKEINPFEAFVLVLKTYLDSYEKKEIRQSIIDILKENNYISYQYQLDAVSQALAVIEKDNGVILADVVGLGKTIIACNCQAVKKTWNYNMPSRYYGRLKRKDSGWNMYKEQFGLYDWEVWSLGDLETLHEFIKTKATDVEIVIIDEAHRFRNQDTKSYESLKNICRSKTVILLTATPFNNRPSDILSLLKLFVTPKKSAITLENNLVDKFKIFKSIFDRLAYIKKYWNSTNKQKQKKAYNYYETLFGEKFTYPEALEKVQHRAKYLAKQIRDIIEPVTIRRNRLDLETNPYYKKEIGNLSKIADPPKEWFFELTKEQSEFYDDILKVYFADPDEGGKFKGAIYRPFEYEREKIDSDKLSDIENIQFIQQRNLFDFMRRLLVKRFESSFGSFEQSLKNFKHIMEIVFKFISKTDKYILDRDLLERIYDKELEEIESCLKEYADKITQGVYLKTIKYINYLILKIRINS